MTKIEALAEFLDVEVKDLEVSSWDENTFVLGDQEYLVLTDEEADDAATERIKESAWAFNKNFIIANSSVLDYDKGSEDILDAIQEKCEDGNDAILRLIDDFDIFVEDAISSDGRGHFLSPYDGNENEVDEYFIYRTN